MTRNKKIILSIIFIIILYFIYKSVLLYLYNYKDRYPSYNKVIDSIEFKDSIDISKGNKDLYSLRRTYSFIINNYISSIIFKNKKEKIKNIFNEERLLNNDINILNKLNCNEKNIKKSTIKSLKKIL